MIDRALKVSGLIKHQPADAYLSIFRKVENPSSNDFALCPLVNMLSREQYLQYTYLKNTIKAKTFHRSVKMISYLSEYLRSTSISNDYTVVLKGSYAKGVPTEYSDIDIMIVHNSIKPDKNKIVSLNNYVNNQNVTITYSNIFLDTYQKTNLGAVVAILMSVPIAGTLDRYIKLKKSAISYLSALSFDQLICLFYRDRYCRSYCEDNKRPGVLIKQGIGGLFDIEICILLIAWAIISGVSLTKEIYKAYTVLNSCYWYNVISKEVLQSVSKTPVESRNIKLQSEHSDANNLVIILGELPEKISAFCVETASALINHIRSALRG